MRIFTTSVNIVLEVSARAFRQQKVVNDILMEKQEVKLPLFTGNNNLVGRKPYGHTHGHRRPVQTAELTHYFGKVAGWKINTQKSAAFLYTGDEQCKRGN